MNIYIPFGLFVSLSGYMLHNIVTILKFCQLLKIQ